MSPEKFHASRKWAETPMGRIAYWERGSGPVALFVHGFPLNSYQWRYAFEGLSDIRRCVALDLLGLGFTEPKAGQPLDFGAQARMVLAFIDALGIDAVDLVGNDSGCAIVQLVAVSAPQRVRTLTLTNGDTHDNWPPEEFKPSYEAALAGQLSRGLKTALASPGIARSPVALGRSFQFPERLTDEVLSVYLGPLTVTLERLAMTDGYIAAMDSRLTTQIEDRLKALKTPTLVVWGDSDVYFPVSWAEWLGRTIPGVRRVEILKDARLFFPEERGGEFHLLLREHWTG